MAINSLPAVNYTQAVKDPIETALGYMNMKARMGEMDLRERQLEQQQAFNERLGELAQNPNAESIQQMMIQYPELTKGWDSILDRIDEQTKASKVGFASDVYTSLAGGHTEHAMGLIEERALAAENSGDAQEAKVLRDLSELMKVDPKTAQIVAGGYLSKAMGPDKFLETFTGLEDNRRKQAMEGLIMDETKANTSKAQAEAAKAAAEAKMAESQELASIYSSGMNIEPFINDPATSKLNKKIAAMTVARDKTTDAKKQEELDLKIQTATEEREEKLRNDRAEVSAAKAGIDNSIATIDEALSNESLDDVLGSMEGGWLGTAKAFFSDEQSDAIATIDTIVSQQFLDNLLDIKARGGTFGALSEKEGERLESAVRSLRRRQSEKQFRKNLQVMRDLLEKAKGNLDTKYGIEKTGSAPAQQGSAPAPGSEEEFNDILSQY